MSKNRYRLTYLVKQAVYLPEASLEITVTAKTEEAGRLRALEAVKHVKGSSREVQRRLMKIEEMK